MREVIDKWFARFWSWSFLLLGIGILIYNPQDTLNIIGGSLTLLFREFFK